MDPVGVLLRAPIFRDLPPAALETLLPHLGRRSFVRGEQVWLEGDAAHDLYVVASGQLKSYRVSRDGREVILALHSGVTILGEVGVFHPRAVRWVGVAAMTACECLTISRAPLVAFLSRHPVAMQGMLQRLSVYAVQAAYSFSGVAFDDIARRVAGALLLLCGEFGEETAQGTRIRVRLSQAELAAHVAASRENVNRALSSLVSAGIVSQHDGHFFVHDLAALRAAVQAQVDEHSG